MAGTEGWGRIVYRKDDRGVILDSQVVPAGEDVPEGFEEKAEYRSLALTTKEAAPVDESKLTVSEEQVDLNQAVDAIKGDEQEGPSDPGGLQENSDALNASADGPQPGDEVAADDGSAEHDASETVDEVKGDEQEGPSDPRGEEAEDTPRPRRNSRRN